MVGGALSSLHGFPFNRNRTAVMTSSQVPFVRQSQAYVASHGPKCEIPRNAALLAPKLIIARFNRNHRSP
jgi:hypothetical protein